MHRDFMYSSLNAFPRSSFSPVSTPLCREVHKKLGKPRYRVRVIFDFYFLQIKIVSLAQLIFYWISHCIVRDRIRLITAYYLEVFTEISWTRFLLAPFNLNLG